MSFKDHFSNQATEYAKFRPRYPHEMFEYLGSLARVASSRGIVPRETGRQQSD